MRHGVAPLAACDRATGNPPRHQHQHPGDLVHIDIDVEKLGRTPGRRRAQGPLKRAAGRANTATASATSTRTPPRTEHSRLAYTEVLADESAATCAGFLVRAAAWFAARGITIRRVLTDNARGLHQDDLARHLRRVGNPAVLDPALAAPDQRQGRTLPPHPAGETGSATSPTPQKTGRQAAFGDWLHWYTRTDPTPASQDKPPADRVTNLPEQHT
ncbi:hypothetical protein Acsp04_50880 [Actinomadura sp. NBRC 104425]|uniref:hypothetical protein n=1 Tax=Actinomadura sp. NBRC 104425 TaxID=3032204 RepID=UPI0024A11AF5|nr:hypothetical protein [Actinomadura sp. NBRC 104425]GLZ14853.1 hypothetical protein Acsp04_50880 [Actinomadura sp. NBRC 104425]